MDPISIDNESTKDLLINAQTHVWNHIYAFLNSMALKCAIELAIPDAIENHGAPMTLTTLANSLSISQHKAPHLARLMNLLIHSNFFSKQILASGEDAYDLTINSRLLLKNHPLTLSPFALFVLDSISIEPSKYFSTWFQDEDETESPYHFAHNKSIWEFGACVPKYDKLLNEAMTSDTQFVASLLLSNNEFRGLFEGLDSLVDVGGGHGTMAKAIAEAFPELACICFDQPHVVQGLEECGNNFKFVGGDMFESIPPAQIVLLKSVLHDWSDEQCIKILQRCNEAIAASTKQGGKIIIIDIVMDTNNYSQLLYDMEMMNLCTGGKERTKEQWEKLFINSGFEDYKIFPILAGPRSVIEVYPSK